MLKTGFSLKGVITLHETSFFFILNLSVSIFTRATNGSTYQPNCLFLSFSLQFFHLFSNQQTASGRKKSTSSAYAFTRRMGRGGLTLRSAHSPERLHSLWFNGHSVKRNSILPHPLLPSGEITGSGLIHKTHRTTLESLLQFKLSNHNGGVGVRLPFSHCTSVCVWLSVRTVGVLSRFIFSGPAGFAQYC